AVAGERSGRGACRRVVGYLRPRDGCIPTQLWSNPPSGIASDRAAAALQRSGEGGHVVLELLIAGDEANQEIGIELARYSASHVELVAVVVGNDLILPEAGAAHVNPCVPFTLGHECRTQHLSSGRGIGERLERLLDTRVALRLAGELENNAIRAHGEWYCAVAEGIADGAVDRACD